MSADTGYVLGHHDPEVERLLLQGRLYACHTEQALRLAGLEPGMRVLDVGCGPGDVALAAARIVGPAGSVTAIDAEPAIVELAARRAAAQDVSTICFQQADIAELTAGEPFDAVVGRLILMHVPDPVETVRTVSRLVRPGGVVTFQEFEVSAAGTAPETPLFRRLCDLIGQAFRAAGAKTEMGTSLPLVFRAAGLPDPQLTSGGCLGPMSDPDVAAFVMGVWRTLLPAAERAGLDLGGMADLDELAGRLRAEAAARDALVLLPPLISAWSRVPR